MGSEREGGQNRVGKAVGTITLEEYFGTNEEVDLTGTFSTADLAEQLGRSRQVVQRKLNEAIRAKLATYVCKEKRESVIGGVVQTPVYRWLSGNAETEEATE